MELSPESNIKTILSFVSDDFKTDPPTSSTLTCLPDIEIKDISFSSALLNLFSGLLPDALEPEIEPLICEPLGLVESMLSDAVMMISDVLDDLVDPIPAELSDKLAPEMTLFHNYTKPIYVDFIPMQPIADFLAGPISEVVNLISSSIHPVDGGPIRIPIYITLDKTIGIDLNEIRIKGLDEFIFEPLSLVGNYTLSTTYEIDHIEFEVELALRNNIGSTDIVTVKIGVHDVVFDFALLFVLEQVILEASQVAAPFIEAIMNLNVTEVDFDAIANTVTDVITEIVSSVNITDITEITDISEVIDIISNVDINEIIATIDFAAFSGLIEIFQELMASIQSIDIITILNHFANSIYGLEIASFSLTTGGFDALEISGLTQLMGPQKMFNEVSDVVFFMYQATLIDVADYFLQVSTRGFINDLIGDSFVYDTCLQEFAGSSVYVPSTSACWKVDLFEGGQLAVDSSDPICSHGNFIGEEIGYFSHVTEDAAHFVGNLNWTSHVVFVEDFSVPKLQVASSMNNQTRTMNMTLTYPSCTQSFMIDDKSSSMPSVQPTSPPSFRPTSSPTNVTMNVTTNVTTNVTHEDSSNMIWTRRSLFELILTYFYPQPDDEVLDWQQK